MIFVVIVVLLAQGLFCHAIPNESQCAEIMSNAGIDVDTFNDSVSHGIHAMTVEHLNFFFNANISVDNNIPTVNTNFSGPDIIPFAPSISDDPESKSLLMKLIDFIICWTKSKFCLAY